MKRNRKIALIGALVAVVAGLAVVFSNRKPHPKVEDQQAVTIAAPALYAAFTSNEQSANATYLNKTLEVSGTINEVSKNQDGKTVLLLDAGDPLGGVQCTLREEKGALAAGSKATVKGFCNGFTMVVILNDCIVAE